MAISKQFLKSKPSCKVTFQLSQQALENVSDVVVLGEFNEWNLDNAAALKKQKDGSFKTTLELPVGQEYQFRYLVNGQNWITDEAADKFVNNGICEQQNAVVVL